MTMTVNTDLHLNAERNFYAFYYMTWAINDTIMELGMICASILAIYQISNGAPIGNFVMLISYWGNFTGKPFAFTVADPSLRLMLYRETSQFRRRSASLGPVPHRCRGTA